MFSDLSQQHRIHERLWMRYTVGISAIKILHKNHGNCKYIFNICQKSVGHFLTFVLTEAGTEVEKSYLALAKHSHYLGIPPTQEDQYYFTRIWTTLYIIRKEYFDFKHLGQKGFKGKHMLHQFWNIAWTLQ